MGNIPRIPPFCNYVLPLYYEQVYHYVCTALLPNLATQIVGVQWLALYTVDKCTARYKCHWQTELNSTMYMTLDIKIRSYVGGHKLDTTNEHVITALH